MFLSDLNMEFSSAQDQSADYQMGHDCIMLLRFVDEVF